MKTFAKCQLQTCPQFCKKALFKANKTKPNHQDWHLMSNSFPTSPYIARNSHCQTVTQGSYWKGITMPFLLTKGRTPKSCYPLQYWHRWTTVSPLPQEFALFSLWFPLIFCILLMPWMLQKHFSIHESTTKSVILHYSLSSWILLQGKYLNN